MHRTKSSAFVNLMSGKTEYFCMYDIGAHTWICHFHLPCEYCDLHNTHTATRGEKHLSAGWPMHVSVHPVNTCNEKSSCELPLHKKSDNDGKSISTLILFPALAEASVFRDEPNETAQSALRRIDLARCFRIFHSLHHEAFFVRNHMASAVTVRVCVVGRACLWSSWPCYVVNVTDGAACGSCWEIRCVGSPQSEFDSSVCTGNPVVAMVSARATIGEHCQHADNTSLEASYWLVSELNCSF